MGLVVRLDDDGNFELNGKSFLPSMISVLENPDDANKIDIKNGLEYAAYAVDFTDFDIYNPPLYLNDTYIPPAISIPTDRANAIEKINFLKNGNNFFKPVNMFGSAANEGVGNSLWVYGDSFFDGDINLEKNITHNGDSSSLKNTLVTPKDWTETSQTPALTLKSGTANSVGGVLGFLPGFSNEVLGRITRIEAAGELLNADVVIKLPNVPVPNSGGPYAIVQDPITGEASWADTSSFGGGVWTESGSDIYYNGGNVGIGTTTPTEKLEVAGYIQSTIGTSNTTKVKFGATGSNDQYPRAAFLVGSDNNVVNTALWVAPDSSAQIGTALEALTNADTSDPTVRRVGVKAEPNGSNVIFSATGYGDSSSTNLEIRANGLSNAASMTFTPTGNVGIGTATPSYPLEVLGNAKLSGNVGINANPGTYPTLRIRPQSGNDARVIIGTNQGNTGQHILGFAHHLQDTSVATGIISQTTTSNGDGRMYLCVRDGSDGSTITTSDAIISLTANDVSLNRTLLYNADTLRIGKTNSGDVYFRFRPESKVAVASKYLGSYNRGDFRVLTYPNADGTVVNIDDHTRLIVDPNGNVGIGTTSPSEKLHVVGNMVLDGGSSNMFIGDSTTGDGITAGQNNVGIGAAALRSATSTTQYALAIGSQAARFGNNNHGMAIGFTAGYNGSASSAYVGSSAGKNAAGQRNVGIGYRSGGGNSNGVQSLYGNVSIGYEAGAVLETSATAVGYQALTALTTGTGNTAIGYQALANLTTGASNTVIGYAAGNSITIRGNNVVIGKEADVSSDTDYGVAIGGHAVASGGYNTAIGFYAGNGSSGAWNVLNGFNTMRLASGSYNAVSGGRSMYSTGGSYNAVLGQGAMDGGGSNNDYNVVIGYNAFQNGSNNVIIGANAASASGTLNNKLYIENSNSSSPLIYGEFDNDIVRVNGDFKVRLPGESYDSLSVGETIVLKPSDNSSVPNANYAAVYIDRDGSTSTDVVALHIGDKLKIKRNGGGTPSFVADNAGFIYTQNYDTNDVSNANPFNNGAGFGARGNLGAIFALSATNGRPAIFGALNSPGASLLFGNPAGYSRPGGAGPYYNTGDTHSTYFFNSANFQVDFGGKTVDGDFRKTVFQLRTAGRANSRSHDANGSLIGSVPTLEISTDNGDVYVTDGSTTVSCALANKTMRGHVLPGMVVYIADDLDNLFISTGASYVKYTIASVDYVNHTFELTTAYSGTTGIANAWIQDKVLKVEGFDGHEIATFYGNDILRVNGEIQVGDPTSTGFKLPTTDGTASQVLSTDGSGNVTWVDQSGGGSSDAEIQLAYKTTDQTLTTTFTAITAWDGEYYDDQTAFDPTTGTLTITQAGTYFIQADVVTDLTSGTARSQSEVYLEFNGSEVAGSRRGMYNRTFERGTTSASIAFPYKHTSGTATFRLMINQTGTDTVVLSNAFFSSITLGGAQGAQGVSGDAFQVAAETSGRTLVAGDHLNYIRNTSATAVTYTVPPQSSVSWVDNAEIVFEQAGAGQITIAAGSGVTINSSESLKSGQQYAVIGLKRVASDVWTLTGERELA